MDIMVRNMNNISTHALTEGDCSNAVKHGVLKVFQLTPSRRATEYGKEAP